ncbi:unnamed protein product, partial [Ectocarpus sp. 13 AM-2016]
AVGVRENLHRQDSNAGGTDVAVDILLSFGGEPCAVSPGDLPLDLAPQGTKDAVFVACCKGDGDTTTTGLPSPAQQPAAPVTPALAPAPDPAAERITTAAAPDQTRVSPGANRRYLPATLLHRVLVEQELETPAATRVGNAATRATTNFLPPYQYFSAGVAASSPTGIVQATASIQGNPPRPIGFVPAARMASVGLSRYAFTCP